MDKSTYAYSWNNPATLTDPDGRCPRCFKTAYKVIKRAYKAAEQAGDFRQLMRLDTWKKAGVDEVVDVVDNVRTLADGDIGFDDLVAVIDLATGFGDEAKAVGKAAGVVEEAGDALKLLPEKAGPIANISPSEVIGKTPAQIDSRAREIGLVPKGPDPANGKGSYVDPSTGVQRILSNPNDPRSGPHAHVNNARGERVGPDGTTVPRESKEAHLPIKVN